MAKKEQKPPQGSDPLAPAAPPANLAEAAANATQFIFSATATSTQNQGPIPPPEMLKRYEDLLPGLAERIIKMAEDEASHRRDIEKQLIAAQIKDANKYRLVEVLGQVFGLMIGMGALASATYAAVHGAQWVAGFIGTAGVTGLVTAFILGRTLHMKMRQQEIEIARASTQPAEHSSHNSQCVKKQ